MKDNLLTIKQKNKITACIKKQDFKKVIAILDSISTAHAGTAKMKDKLFVIKEITNFIKENFPQAVEQKFYSAGKKILSIPSDNAKEVGIKILWRAYGYNSKSVEKYLYKVTNDENWELREYAAGALASTLKNFPGFYKTLKKWSKDSSVNIRRGVVMSAAGLIGSDKKSVKKAFSLLEPLMYDKSVYIKKNLGPFILGAYFGNNYPAETFKQLDLWFKIKDENVRWNIIMAFNNSFGNKYPMEALKYLKLLSGDNSRVVQRAIKSTLNHLKKRHKSIDFKYFSLNS
jgi:3-methyladenine DNA glycosylase AlkC